MGNSTKTMRRSIHAFLQNYHSFAAVAALLVFPFSASILLSQTFTLSSSPILKSLYYQMLVLFQAGGFPASSQFFSLISLKLSQTTFSFVATFPFTITCLLLGKASVIQILGGEFPHRRFNKPTPLPSLLRFYFFLLPTHLFNSIIIFSANAAVFSLLFLAFNAVDALHLSSGNVIPALSAAGAILYSIVLANTMVICNLAAVVAAMEKRGGCLPVLKACVLIRGREGTAITLGLPANLGLAAIEALFQYRVVRPCQISGRFNPSAIGEAFLITYMHSLLIVLDVIISCMLYRRCRSGSRSGWESEVYFHLESEGEEKDALHV